MDNISTILRYKLKRLKLPGKLRKTKHGLFSIIKNIILH